MAQSKPKDDRPKMMIYPSWADMLMAAPPEYCKSLLTAMWQYRNGTPYEELALDPITATLFAGMRTQMDIDMQNYAETKTRNQENGRKHGSVKDASQTNPTACDDGADEPIEVDWNPNEPRGTQMNPVGSSDIPDEPNTTQSGGVKDKDKVKVKDKDLGERQEHPPTPLAGEASAPTAVPDTDSDQATDASGSSSPAKRTRPKKQLSPELQAWFDNDFWPLYPRHEGKEACRRALVSLSPDITLRAEIIAGLNRALECDKNFRERNIGFIPHPSTWLNQRRWEDEYDTSAPVQQDRASPPYRSNSSDEPFMTDWAAVEREELAKMAAEVAAKGAETG